MNICVYNNDTTNKIITDGSKNILEILQENDIFIDAPCNGNGKCGKCKAIISGGINAITKLELDLLSKKDIDKGTRLACMCYPQGDCNVTLNTSDFGVKLDGTLADFVISPRAKTTETSVGLAIDIGTTTLAFYFYDLTTGVKIYTTSALNPQRVFGADVISRINACIENTNGADLLQACIVNKINDSIDEFVAKTKRSNDDIVDLSIAGNTVMLHLLTHENAIGIATAPFVWSSLFGYDVDAKSLKINVNETAKIYLTDCVAGYVGGDITVGILATDTHKNEKPCIFIDIGTNGEMAIGDKDGFICCATAAGPAFEGAHIKCGVGGIDGAINSVTIVNNDIELTTIGGKPAIGICGSGLISAVSALLKLNVIDETGRIDEDNIDEALMYRYFEDDEPCFLLDTENNIMLTQKDIREVQLAKAAIAAGINTLINAKGLKFSDIDKVILAGGFGSYIDKTSACEIGLLPIELLEKIVVVGNAAGMGAVRLLLDKDGISTLNDITSHCKYYELSGDSFFQDEYVNQMCFE